MSVIISKSFDEIPKDAIIVPPARDSRALKHGQLEFFEFMDRWVLRRFVDPEDPDSKVEIYELSSQVRQIVMICLGLGRNGMRNEIRRKLGL